MRSSTSRVPSAAAICFLLLAAIGRWPYGFYTLLRFVVCGSAAYLAYEASEARRNGWMWAMLAGAILFNPLIPISFERDIWRVFDFATAVVFSFAAASGRRRASVK